MPSKNFIAYRALDNGEELEVRVSYQKGGMNYFNYKTEPRGIFLSLSPVRRSVSSGGFGCTERSLFDKRAGKILIEEMARDNAKRVETVAARIKEQFDAIHAAYKAGDWMKIGELAGADMARMKELAKT